jgi:hypothetical protein
MLVTANHVHSPSNFVTVLREALRSSETSVLKTVTRRTISEDGILHSHRVENLKSSLVIILNFTHCLCGLVVSVYSDLNEKIRAAA